MQHSIPYSRRLPIGAECQPDGGVHIRLWAPKCRRVHVVFENSPALELTREPNGYHWAFCESAKAGDLYRFRLNDGDALYPDPASRRQPGGVHGPSQVVDPSAFQWSDLGWKGVTSIGQVLYEMHIGTFTREGTWNAAAEKLPLLKSLGITCVEMMPVGEFAGEFGWGYDGVDLFAPTRAYGTPDDLRRFVDSAHAHGIGVILDVVYNHVGPAGNYLTEFSDQYFTASHGNDWGESLNFDGAGCAGVREYFISNARHWIVEYHLDGFRFDATHAIFDDSTQHILAEITHAAREAAGTRSIYLVSESESQDARIARSPEKGGYGMDALWNDDFHHSGMVALTGRNEAYFADYTGSSQELISACKWGYLFQGQLSGWQMKRRGSGAMDLQPNSFVNYIQNHDQIANYGRGERAHQLSGLAQCKAMTVLLLLAPQTPLLFQGQEFAASSPFLYFADHSAPLPELIRQGRLKELGQFSSQSHSAMQAAMHDPADPRTFQLCKLDWSQQTTGWHAQIHKLHQDLLELRRGDPALNRLNSRHQMDGAVIGPQAFVLRFFSDDGDRLVLINLGPDLHLRTIAEPLLAPPAQMRWDVLLSTESPLYGGTGIATFEPHGKDWRLPGVNLELSGRCAIVLRPVALTEAERSEYDRLERDRQAERK